MKNHKTKTLLCLAAALLAAGSASASALFTETADNAYYNSGWNYGGSAANSFGWYTSASSSSGGYAGFYIGDSRNIGSAGNYPDINTGGKSFGLYGGKGSTGGSGQADAYGFLKDGAGNNQALSVGQVLSLDIAVNWRNGYKGFAARNAGNDAEVFTLNVGGDDYTVFNATTGNGSIGNAWSDNTVFHIAVTQTTASGGSWAITRSGGVSDYDTGTYTGAISSFKLYCGQTDAGSPNDFVANNISVAAVPEPASLTLLSLGAFALVLRRRA